MLPSTVPSLMFALQSSRACLVWPGRALTRQGRRVPLPLSDGPEAGRLWQTSARMPVRACRQRAFKTQQDLLLGPDEPAGSGEPSRPVRPARPVPLRILIADDHRLLRAGLRALLKTEPQIEVVGEAGDGDEALALANSLNPDIILADISMPGPSGIEIARELREQSSEIRVLILTMHEDDLLARDALQAGASGYLVKRAAESDLVAAIQTVAEGGTYLDESLRASTREAEAAPAPPSLEPAPALTPAERDVLRALAQGRPNQQVAEELHLTLEVLAEIRARLAEKLGAHSRLDLIAHARRMKLL